MIGEPWSFRRAWGLFLDPATREKRRLLGERWTALDPSLRLPGQGLGQKATGCGATIGIQPRCDFSCTGCYLGKEANDIPALPTAALLRQLDDLRRFLGPKSNVQITDGEATLRPVEELTEILRYARSIGVIPMLMTHGDSFRRRPGLLERLMTEGGLTEVSIHVDITQRGREGAAYRVPRNELELMPLRDELADVVRKARRSTGRPLRAAMTLTVTRDNLSQIADVVRWLVANRDAFSLVSFQPLAQVGRTRKNEQGVTAGELWREIGKGTASFGLELTGTGPLHFGHTECTRFVPLLALEKPGEEPRLYQAFRERDADIVQEFFAQGLGGVAFRDDHPGEKVARALGMLRTAPAWLLGRGRRWVSDRFRAETGLSLFRLLLDQARGRLRVDGLTLTSHHFMSPEEVRTPLGQERLAACVFRLPYKGEMVPMCKMNADGVRERFYAEILAGSASEEPARRSLPVLP